MKKTKSLVVTVLFLFTLVDVFCQRNITGKVLDRQTNLPIAYVNIGIVNTTVGSISNHDGSFSINIPDSHNQDTLIFSALGYSRRSIPVTMLGNEKAVNIYLGERKTILNEITVTSTQEKYKEFDLGNRYFKGGLNLSPAEDATAGASVALLIDNKYPSYYDDLRFPVFLKEAKVRIADNTTGKFKIRVRLYDVDSLTGFPGNDFLNESLVLESEMIKGWLNFDLTRYHLQVAGPFFIAFEWIMEDKDRAALKSVYREFETLHPERVKMDTTIVDGKKIAARHYIQFLPGTSFGVSLLKFSIDNYKCYSRANSLGTWERAPYILSSRVTVTNQLQSDLPASVTVLKKPCSDDRSICVVREWCNNFLEEHAIPGMQLSISKNSKTLISEGFGFADLRKKIPVTRETQFRLGSVSKALTSSALIKLVADGKLNLDAPVQQYVSEYPQKKFTLTTRQLAGHLGGIRHYNEQEELFPQVHFRNCVDAITIFKNDSLLYNPGQKYFYSSYGWNLIGAVIEGAARQNYLDYMSTNIWKPLNLLHISGDVKDSVMVNKSKFYFVTGEEAINYDLSYKYPSGGLLSTTEDLLKYGNELLHGKYFDRALVSELFKTQFTTDQSPTNYGLGWNTTKDKNGHRVYFHAGNLLEGSAYLLIYPDDDLVIAMLANSQAGIAFDVQSIGELFYKK